MPEESEPLAQLEEHRTFNPGVPGSSPGWLTKAWPLGRAWSKTSAFHAEGRGSNPLGVTTWRDSSVGRAAD